MTNLRRLAALPSCSVLFIAPGISATQLFSPIPEQASETSNPTHRATHTAQGQESRLIVADIEAAHAEFVSRGIDASEMWAESDLPIDAGDARGVLDLWRDFVLHEPHIPRITSGDTLSAGAYVQRADWPLPGSSSGRL